MKQSPAIPVKTQSRLHPPRRRPRSDRSYGAGRRPDVAACKTLIVMQELPRTMTTWNPADYARNSAAQQKWAEEIFAQAV